MSHDNDDIHRGLSRNARSTLGQDQVRHLSRRDEVREQNEKNREADKRAALWFDAGVRGCEKALALAADLGVGEDYFSKMRTGSKPIPLRSITVFEANPAAVLGFTAGLLGSVNMIAVPLVADIDMKPGQAALLRHARATLGALWPAYRDGVAALMFHCEGALLELHIDQEARMGRP